MMRIAIAGLLLLVGTQAHADEVKDRADNFGRTVASMKEACGVAIAASYDVRIELGAKRSRAPGTGYEYCESVIAAVRSTCSQADAKAIVATKLKTVTCRFEDGIAARSPAGPTRDFDLKLERGALTVSFDFRSSNLDSDTSKFLGVSLGINDARSLKRHQTTFGTAVEKMHETCGAKIDVSYDLASELTAERANRDHGNGYTFCVNLIEGIERVCSSSKTKQEIAANLKHVQCRMEHGSSAKMSEKTKGAQFTDLAMTNGVLTMLFDWNTANVADEVTDFLKRRR